MDNGGHKIHVGLTKQFRFFGILTFGGIIFLLSSLLALLVAVVIFKHVLLMVGFVPVFILTLLVTYEDRTPRQLLGWLYCRRSFVRIEKGYSCPTQED